LLRYQGLAVVYYGCALECLANERLGLARRVKIFEKLSKKVSDANCHLPTISKVVNNRLFLLTIK